MKLMTTLQGAVAGVCLFARALSAQPELFYEVPAPYSEDASWETRLDAGYDFSNPYLNVYAFRVGGYRILSPIFAAGLEGTLFTTTNKPATKTLEDTLRPYGYETQALAPQWSTAAVLRVTPLSGLLNVFRRQAWSAEISLLLRAGAIQYQQVGTAPLFGTGLEVSLGVAKNVGVHADINWDADALPSRDWQSRVGFRVGPVVRF